MGKILEFVSSEVAILTLWCILMVTIAIMIACIIINEKKKEE
jgi:hypothetical protein